MALPNIDFDSTSYDDGLELVKSAAINFEDIKNMLSKLYEEHPEWVRAGAGAAGGAGLGALSSLAQRPGRRTPWQRALTGGIIGGGGTAAAEQLYNALQEGGKIDTKVGDLEEDEALRSAIAESKPPVAAAAGPRAGDAFSKPTPQSLEEADKVWPHQPEGILPKIQGAYTPSLDGITSPANQGLAAGAAMLGAGSAPGLRNTRVPLHEQAGKNIGVFADSSKGNVLAHGALGRVAFDDVHKALVNRGMKPNAASASISRYGTEGAWNRAPKMNKPVASTGSAPPPPVTKGTHQPVSAFKPMPGSPPMTRPATLGRAVARKGLKGVGGLMPMLWQLGRSQLGMRPSYQQGPLPAEDANQTRTKMLEYIQEFK